jgi:NAD(P)-dependent dehydrogenase (short-subunit alcohol dehydrogenase family)
MGLFAGKTVLITGAAGGFGRGAAERFALEGARLVLSDIRAEGLVPVEQALLAKGAEVVCLAADVAKSADHKKLVELALSRFGSLDVALNNAGIAHQTMKAPLIDDETAERVIAVDLLGVFYAMKAQLPVMEKQGGGVIVNIASVAGLVGAPLMSIYSAAKHGVVGLTKSIAPEYARKNIRINAICPAFAATPMVEAELYGDGGTTAEKLLVAMPMRRLGTVDEIVEAIIFAASQKNSFMTGLAMAVDGGLSAL